MSQTNEDLKLRIDLSESKIVTLKGKMRAIQATFKEEKEKNQIVDADIQAKNVENERLKLALQIANKHWFQVEATISQFHNQPMASTSKVLPPYTSIERILELESKLKMKIL